jgi:S-DNA-T family DNA segregation ATPase FtsK/SpoIIIE
MPGLTALLALVAISFLAYLSIETITFIRKLFNPLRYLKKIPMTVNVGGADNSEEPEPASHHEPQQVFDNPYREEIEFPIDETPASPVSQSKKPVVKEVETGNGDEVEMTVETGEKEEKADSKEVANDNYGDISTPYDPKRDLENYRYPTLDLLQKYESDGKPYIDMQEQTNNKNRIVEVLRSFGVEISSIKATVGPTITLYEITPAPGVRISKIHNLEDDIALSLSALGIRIIAPIPGKGTIGIEVPNAKPTTVSMESIQPPPLSVSNVRRSLT